MASHDIDNVPELRDIYGQLPENSLARRIIFRTLHRHHCAFIALSPFMVIASADRDGAPDISPRGDLPGFAMVRDEHTIVIPDRPGNKKLVTLTNVLENPAISLIFFVPGRTESLRVNGRAQITTDPELLLPLAAYGKMPQSALVIAVELAWLHCGRALIRSRLWQHDSYPAANVLPSLGMMIADEIGGIDPSEAEARLDRANTTFLWGEAVSRSS
jgi:hypothetical protein